MVDFTLEKEWERSISVREIKETPIYYVDSRNSKVSDNTVQYEVNAAHARTDKEVTYDEQQHDENIMDDPDF